jgi:hypothetical protein
MTDKPEDILAFPQSDINGCPVFGMTLRDYFAASALTGLLAYPSGQYINGEIVDALNATLFSLLSYELADAMLKARQS